MADLEYFVFSVNSPCSRMVYGEEIVHDSCLLFCKLKKLTPIGQDSIRFFNADSDKPPIYKETLEVLKEMEIKLTYTTNIFDFPDSTFFGLKNVYAPKDWDYDADPFPPAEVYFSVSETIIDYFSKNGIKVLKI